MGLKSYFKSRDSPDGIADEIAKTQDELKRAKALANKESLSQGRKKYYIIKARKLDKRLKRLKGLLRKSIKH